MKTSENICLAPLKTGEKSLTQRGHAQSVLAAERRGSDSFASDPQSFVPNASGVGRSYTSGWVEYGTRETAFVVNHVHCVLRNYYAHALEMGDNAHSEEPVFFGKPGLAAFDAKSGIPYPRATNRLEYEVEFVVSIAAGGEHVSINEAKSLICGWGLGIDLTRRDLQQSAKQNRHPWDAAKAFKQSAPCSELTPCDYDSLPKSGELWLKRNGQKHQSTDLKEMHWSAVELISFLSEQFPLQPGDLVMTGTPAGVGVIEPGDELEFGLDDRKTVRTQILSPIAA